MSVRKNWNKLDKRERAFVVIGSPLWLPLVLIVMFTLMVLVAIAMCLELGFNLVFGNDDAPR